MNQCARSLTFADFNWTFNLSLHTCQPCRRRLLSTALNHIMASPAWKSRNLWQRSRRKIPKHFNNSDVEACNEWEEQLRGLTQKVFQIKLGNLFRGSCVWCGFACGQIETHFITWQNRDGKVWCTHAKISI